MFSLPRENTFLWSLSCSLSPWPPLSCHMSTTKILSLSGLTTPIYPLPYHLLLCSKLQIRSMMASVEKVTHGRNEEFVNSVQVGSRIAVQDLGPLMLGSSQNSACLCCLVISYTDGSSCGRLCRVWGLFGWALITAVLHLPPGQLPPLCSPTFSTTRIISPLPWPSSD